MLTAQSTAAAPSQDDYRPATTTTRYEAGSLTGVVHAPRTLVGMLPMVFHFRGSDVYAQELARQGFVVVLVDDRFSLDRHRELWRGVVAGTGPLAERFGRFAGHLAVAEP
ncbi:hypothetical protein [Lentzea waywayandensis]|uniref:hypothetical protein n=1 Tax=Lentzea waywayandensis TaxID=84724 RepID=UPI0011605A04|nr:hypothetical protein [Lentzea waywayandensis]